MNLIFLNRRIHLALGLLALCGVFIGSVTTSPFPDTSLALNSDKVVHLLAYGGLSLWFAQIVTAKRYHYLAVGLFSYGAMIEWVQSLLPHRSASLLDLLANFTGIVLALGICLAASKASRI